MELAREGSATNGANRIVLKLVIFLKAFIGIYIFELISTLYTKGVFCIMQWLSQFIQIEFLRAAAVYILYRSNLAQCSALYYKTLHCSTLQFSAVPCSAVYYKTLHCTAIQCSSVYYKTLHWSTLQCSVVQCSTKHCIAVHCNSVQCSAVFQATQRKGRHL